MQPETETDHMALLALTMVGILTQRLNELGQLDEPTSPANSIRLCSASGSMPKRAG